ncbi:zinc-ribbon domain-containing protein [Candidatus Binatus sp.]|uniref:zinc-ribbon domain-containing protein n=1 Tax=Candidatus Binatus sp. TaxID=2811406 RepID=UPI003CBE1FC5
MIEIQCTSCHTRYRIDERVLPDDTPTFKCSRCGHVFNADPVPAKARKPAPQAPESESQAPRTIRPARPRPSALKSPVESDVVKREHSGELRPTIARKPEARPPSVESERRESAEQRTPAAPPVQPEDRSVNPPQEPEADDPLNRTFGDRDQKADTGENLRFDFSDERIEVDDASPDHELERPEPRDDGWQVGDVPDEFASAPIRRAPTMMAEPEPAPRPAPTPVRRMAAPLEAEAPRFATQPAQAKSTGFQLGHVDDTAEVESPGATHAAGFFLAIFFFVAIAFLAASAIICDEPVASARILAGAPQIGGYFARPIVPAMLVALHDVRSEYYTLKGGHVALVITGNAQNVGERPLHLVAIDADLIGDTAHPIASQNVYCGNELSAQMLGEMTPREIEFSQGLSPQKAFAIEPSESVPFLMVFIDPPTGAGKIRISVSKAEPGASAEPQP